MSGQLDYEINKELGECYLFMGDLDKAEEYYKKAMNSNGVHPESYLGLATIAVQRGELENAMVLYKKAAGIEADDRSLAGMALIEMEYGQQDAAFEHFKGALAKNPENLVALFGMIRLAYVAERYAEVIPHLKDYLAIDPLKHEVRYTLAGCLISIGQSDEACAHIERILEHDPANASAVELMNQLRQDAA